MWKLYTNNLFSGRKRAVKQKPLDTIRGVLIKPLTIKPYPMKIRAKSNHKKKLERRFGDRKTTS